MGVGWPVLSPERDRPRYDDHEIDLAEQRLDHRQRLPQRARGDKVAVSDGREGRVAEEEEIARRPARRRLYEESTGEKDIRQAEEVREAHTIEQIHADGSKDDLAGDIGGGRDTPQNH